MDIWVLIVNLASLKATTFLAVFLIMVLMTPIVRVSFAILGHSGDLYELVENAAEEEKSEEREKRDKEEIEDEKELKYHRLLATSCLLELRDHQYIARSNRILGISIEVLTPPPEYI